MATAAIAPPARGARLTLPFACAGFGALTALAVVPRTSPPTTYGAASAAAAVVGLGAGFALLAAAAATSLVRPRRSIALVTALLGVTWLANDWIGWDGGPPIARSIAMVAVPFLVPLLVHLTLAYPTGRMPDVSAWIVALVHGATAVVSVGHALFRDPFRDLGCWSNCVDNSFLVRAEPDAVRLLDNVWLATVTSAAFLTVAAGAIRFARATVVARRSMWPVLASAAVAAAGSAIHVWLVDDRTEDPTAPSFRTIFLVRAIALLGIAAGVAWGLWRVDRTRRSVTQLADELGATPAPGSFESALTRSLGDEDLTVAYWLPSSQRYVDAAGHEVDPRPGAGQVSTAIVRNGEPVALVIHDDALAPQDEIGAAARLAVDNERLRAEVLARVADLRASRARIVVAADGTRQRLERDLHDGAQQRLLAASFELRQACSSAAASGDSEFATRLTDASEQVQQALTELRDLAHGIYPAILTEAGLDPAVRALAERARLPVEVVELVSGRFPAVVESTAYTVVAGSIDDAVRRAAPYVAVCIAREGDQLVVHVDTGAASPSPHVVVDLTDRVGALGGVIETSKGGLRAEIPCAS